MEEEPDDVRKTVREAHTEGLREAVVAALKTVFDPEIPVNVYDLGLVYEVRLDADGGAEIVMSLTSPSCPAAQSLPGEVEERVREVPGVKDVKVEVTWDPPWSPARMTEAARLQLGLM